MQPNVLFILCDQLRAASLPVYGETQIDTPNLNAFASQGIVFENAISTYPLCTPYRAMLLTGRHPQTTGHLINSTRTRHTEISIADAFANAGYRTGWIGKWHLHTGSFPAENQPDFVPEGRDRLGFHYWRGYNMHMRYFGGWVGTEDWEVEQWEGFETEGLLKYVKEFMWQDVKRPFLLFVSPHQPHWTPFHFAPQELYEQLPDTLVLPENVAADAGGGSTALLMYRHYLAMILALDRMVGELMTILESGGRLRDTIVIFTSDHGTQAGAHGIAPWEKRHPYEESIRVPLIVRFPDFRGANSCNDALIAPVDLFPTLCSLCDVSIPRTVEGFDLSNVWEDRQGAFEQKQVLLMNFSARYDWFADGLEWRGIRTKKHTYVQWLDGRTELYDNAADPLQTSNLSGRKEYRVLENELREGMKTLMNIRKDRLLPCHEYKNWHDAQRRVVRNASGALGDPEGLPDWSLLG